MFGDGNVHFLEQYQLELFNFSQVWGRLDHALIGVSCTCCTHSMLHTSRVSLEILKYDLKPNL